MSFQYEYRCGYMSVFHNISVTSVTYSIFFFFFQAEDGIRDLTVTGVQTCALPISGVHRDGHGAGYGLCHTGRSPVNGIAPFNNPPGLEIHYKDCNVTLVTKVEAARPRDAVTRSAPVSRDSARRTRSAFRPAGSARRRRASRGP